MLVRVSIFNGILHSVLLAKFAARFGRTGCSLSGHEHPYFYFHHSSKLKLGVDGCEYR